MDKDKPTEETLLDIADKPGLKTGGAEAGSTGAAGSAATAGSDDQAWSFDEGLSGPEGQADEGLAGEFTSGSAALDTSPGVDLSFGDDGDGPAAGDDGEAGVGLELDLSAGFDADGADGTLAGGFDSDDQAGFDAGETESPLTVEPGLDDQAETAYDSAVAGDAPAEDALGEEPAGYAPTGADETAEVTEDLMGNGPESASWSSGTSGAEPGDTPAPAAGGSLYDELTSPSSDDEDSGGGGGGGGGDFGGGGGYDEGRRGRGKLIAALAAAAVIAAGAFGGVPYWAGMQVEKVYRESMAKLSDSGSLVVESIDYRRGWLGSSVDTVLSTGGLMPVTIEIASHEKIDHGFGVVGELLTGDLSPSASIEGEMETRVKMGEMTVANLPKATHSTVMDTTGAGETTFEVAPFTSPPGSPMQVSWKGMSGRVGFSASPASARGSFTITPLKVDTPGGSFLVRNVATDFDLTEGLAGLMVGRQVVSIGAVEASSEGKSFKVDTVMFSSNAAAAGTKMNYSISERVQKIEFNGRKLGPGNMEIRLRNLDAATLAKVKNIFTKMQKMQLAGEEPGPEMTKSLVTLLAALANGAPSIEIPEFTFDTGEGVVDGNIRVVVDGRGKDLAANPAMALAALDVEAGLSVPVSLVNKASTAAAARGGKSPAKAIGDLVAGGFVVKADGSYRTSVTLKGGELKVNGKDVENTLPLLMMLGPGGSPGVVDPAGPCDDRAPAMAVAGVAPGACADDTASPDSAGPSAGDGRDDLASVEEQADSIDRAEPVGGQAVAAAPSVERASAPAEVKGADDKEKTYDVAGDIRILSSRGARWIDRNEAARRLGEAGDPKAVEPLIQALADDPDPFVRRESALSLGHLGDARAAGPLNRALDDDDEWVRKYAGEALSELKKGGAVLNAGL